MDCDLCSIEEGTEFNVPTPYGLKRALCRGCFVSHARVSPRRRPSHAIRSARRRSDQPRNGAGQLWLPFPSETGGPATAACSCALTSQPR